LWSLAVSAGVRRSHILFESRAASHEAIAKLREEDILPRNLTVRTSKYLNNLIEQDHRHVKRRVRPMLGCKRFESAGGTISGIELVHRIQKEQFDVAVLDSAGLEAVLAA